MAINIKTGVKKRPQKVCIKGPEGSGKSTLAADLERPLFIDAEGGTDHMDVDRVEVNTMDQIREVFQHLKKEGKGKYRTLVLDTIDWIEKCMIKELCAEFNTDSIEKILDGYGKGYTELEDRMHQFLQQLEKVAAQADVHIVLLAHTKVQKFEDPELASSYDRYMLKMEKKTSALVKEWVDALLFLNFDTKLADQAGTMNNKKRGVQGKKRRLGTVRTAAYDAKSRHGLPDIVPVGEDHPAAGLKPLFDFGGEAAPAEEAPKEEPKKEVRRDQEEGADEIPGIDNPPSELEQLVEKAGGIEAVSKFCVSKRRVWDESMQKSALLKPDAFVAAVKKVSGK